MLTFSETAVLAMVAALCCALWALQDTLNSAVSMFLSIVVLLATLAVVLHWWAS